MPRVTTILRAVVDEWALMACLGLALGIAVGLVQRSLRKAGWFGGVYKRVVTPSRWFAYDPEGFVAVVSAALTAGVVAYASWRAFSIVSVAFAQKQFAGLAMALITLALVAGALVVFSLANMLLRPLPRVLGVLANMGTLFLLGVAGAIVCIVLARDLILNLFENGLWRRYIAAPMVLIAYALAAILVRLVARRRSFFLRRMSVLAASAVVVGLCLFLWSALTYGHLQSVREIVERRAIVGSSVVRTYMRLFDRDRDGYSALFADSDCDDKRANVHPGAFDRPGDGIDADCFGGDGSPNVSPFGNGSYGAMPRGIHRPNIVLVTVDALRSDHLGAYGYARRTSPNLDRFARTATRFTDVIAPSSRTVAAMPAIMTGFYPSQIARGTQYFYPALLPENTTVAESLASAGYKTVAIASTYFFGRIEGYFQGFDTVEQVTNFHSTREWPVDNAIAHIDRLRVGTDPWFVWVHLFNVHADYLGDGHASQFGHSLRDKYDTEVALMDEQMGRLFEALKERDLDGTTAIVFTADHGEAFGEHGTYFHETLYDEELRPPLMVHLPGGTGAVSRAPVSTIDVAPTILNLANVHVPRPMPAQSLVPLLNGGDGLATRVRFAERLPDGWASINQKAIYEGSLKLLWFLEDGRLELYDHRTDRLEQTNLADVRVAETQRMLGELRAWASQTASSTMRDDEILRANRFRHPPAHLDHRMGTRFEGLFTVLGYNLPRTPFAPGESIPFDFFYRVDQETSRDLTFEILFETPPGFPNVEWFHGRHLPVLSRYRTPQWRAGEYLRDSVVIPIPTFAPRGSRIHVTFRVVDHGEALHYEGDPTGNGVVRLPDIEIE
ncbi:MAG: sulfatase-like hydrolase/transferase [Sandaracinaceae bacterium]|nr:sulfatase-like hydrolase/transferase [Sandaracinaceae bacterium]